MNDITILVLAGGEGKRFWPIETSKSLISHLGKSLLVHNLMKLRKTGFSRVLVVCHPHDEHAVNALKITGLTIQCVVQKEPKGMADAVLSAKQYLHGPCLIMNAEDLVDDSLYKDLAKKVVGQKHVMVGLEKETYFDGGYFQFEHEKLVGIVEKPGKGNEPSKLVNLVFDYFPQVEKFVELLISVHTEHDDQYEHALSEIIKNYPVEVITYKGDWYPSKYPWHLLDIMDQLLVREAKEHRGNNIEIKSNVVIEGPVHIGDNVKIFENTKIVGPCYIGDNTIVGNNNIIRHSHIGADCVTGFNTDITRSYVGDECWFHSNYIGDSVLEKNISMGSGAVLANLRLDDGEIPSHVAGSRMNTKRTKLGAIIGEGVRIGVNASIMPGVKIGRRSFIGAGVVLDKDLEDESFCIANTGYTTTKNTKTSSSSTSREAYKKHIG